MPRQVLARTRAWIGVLWLPLVSAAVVGFGVNYLEHHVPRVIFQPVLVAGCIVVFWYFHRERRRLREIDDLHRLHAIVIKRKKERGEEGPS